MLRLANKDTIKNGDLKLLTKGVTQKTHKKKRKKLVKGGGIFNDGSDKKSDKKYDKKNDN